jgi:hypothetical protein
MKDSTRRGLRTALQLVLSLATTGGLQGILALLGHALTAEQYAALTGALLPFVTVAVNSLEDAGTIPAVLKAPASDGQDPVPNDAGYVDLGYLVGMFCVVAGIFVAIFNGLIGGLVLIAVGLLVLFLRE